MTDTHDAQAELVAAKRYLRRARKYLFAALGATELAAVIDAGHDPDSRDELRETAIRALDVMGGET